MGSGAFMHDIIRDYTIAQLNGEILRAKQVMNASKPSILELEILRNEETPKVTVSSLLIHR